MWSNIKTILKRYFLTGLLVLLPMALTVIILKSIIKALDNLFPIPIPGVGLILTITIILLTGILTTNLLGRKILSWWEGVLDRIPLVSGIYKSIKQIMEAIFREDRKGFKRVVLIEYPRKGIYTMAFVTSTNKGKFRQYTDGKEALNVFIPTTPNPTSGWYIVVPKKDAIDLDMSIADAFKVIISGGIVTPEQTRGIGD